MTGTAELLRPTEAAVVSGVELSIVHHAIDRMLPPRLVRKGRGKSVAAEACFYIAFYHASANKLTADERRFAIFDVDKRVEPTSDMPARWASLLRHCVVRHDWLHIDLEPFLTQTHERWDRYVAALSMVKTDPGILGGTPVIAGTRIPVHDVAASATAGLPASRIREAYRGLSDEQIEVASLYARANPLQGRPPERRMLGEDSVIARRVIERRQATA